MNRHPARRPILLGASLLALLAAAAPARAQEPAKPSAMADAPVRKELEEFNKGLTGKVPADRLKMYEQGIDDVRKAGVVEKALKVGDKAPDFELPDATGKKVKLSDLTARGPVIVTWYRGGWCPYCNIALRGFQKEMDQVRDLNATLVAISPELPDNSMSTMEKNHLAFPVLSDKGSKTARAYGVSYKVPTVIADQMKDRLMKSNGDDSMELPLGATYVVDRAGVIRYAFVDHDYRKRAEPAAVLAAVRALEKKN